MAKINNMMMQQNNKVLILTMDDSNALKNTSMMGSTNSLGVITPHILFKSVEACFDNSVLFLTATYD